MTAQEANSLSKSITQEDKDNIRVNLILGVIKQACQRGQYECSIGHTPLDAIEKLRDLGYKVAENTERSLTIIQW